MSLTKSALSVLSAQGADFLQSQHYHSRLFPQFPPTSDKAGLFPHQYPSTARAEIEVTPCGPNANRKARYNIDQRREGNQEKQ